MPVPGLLVFLFRIENAPLPMIFMDLLLIDKQGTHHDSTNINATVTKREHEIEMNFLYMKNL